MFYVTILKLSTDKRFQNLKNENYLRQRSPVLNRAGRFPYMRDYISGKGLIIWTGLGNKKALIDQDQLFFHLQEFKSFFVQ